MKKKQNFFADVLSTVTKYFLIFVAVVILYLLCSGIRVVESGNVALVLRFGKLVGDNYEEQVHEPGLLFAFPYFVDEVVIVPSENVFEQTVTTHYTDPEALTKQGGGYLITGDQNIAVVSASVKYIISDPVAYALHVNQIEDIINATVSTSMVYESARIGVDELLTFGKEDFGKSVRSDAMEKIDRLGIGVDITSLELTQVSMPNEVKEIYDAVNAATVEAQTVIKEALQYRENIIPEAHSKADSLISEAKSYYSMTVAYANTDISEFWGCLDEFKSNPDLVKTRIYAQKFREAMSKIATVRVVQDGETHIVIKP